MNLAENDLLAIFAALIALVTIVRMWLAYRKGEHAADRKHELDMAKEGK